MYAYLAACCIDYQFVSKNVQCKMFSNETGIADITHYFEIQDIMRLWFWIIAIANHESLVKPHWIITIFQNLIRW